jgi:hypothetical protein
MRKINKIENPNFEVALFGINEHTLLLHNEDNEFNVVIFDKTGLILYSSWYKTYNEALTDFNNF